MYKSTGIARHLVAAFGAVLVSFTLIGASVMDQPYASPVTAAHVLSA